MAAAALRAGWEPESLISDSPFSITGANGVRWQPKNYGGKYHGPVTLAEALPQGPFDMVLLAVPHQAYLDLGDEALRGLLTEAGTLADLKGVLNGSADWTL